MILSDTDLDSRLNSPDNLINSIPKVEIRTQVEIRTIPHGGRGKGDLEIPPAVRALIGSVYNEGDETQAEVAEAFGVSQPIVGMASRGLVGNRYDSNLAKEVSQSSEAKVNSAHELALDALMGSLDALNSPEKAAEVRELSPTKLAKLASDLSKITSNLKPADSGEGGVKVQVVLFAPNRMRTEKEYETVNA